MRDPITKGDDPSDFGPTDLRAQICEEVRAAASVAGGQLQLGQDLGYATAAPINKIINGTARLTVARAGRLDAWLEEQGKRTKCGFSMRTLAMRLQEAIQEERAKETDVFVACPMSAAGKAYETKVRRHAMGLIDALRSHDLRVYSAVEDIKTSAKFDTYDFAYRANLRHILSSRLFVLYLPTPEAGATQPSAPSSVWIELGMALAKGIPCTIFVPDAGTLPYIVRRAVNDEKSKTPVLDVQAYGTDAKQPARWVKVNGPGVLLGGAGL